MLRLGWRRLAPTVIQRQTLQQSKPIWYHGTSVFYRRQDDDDDESERIIIPGQPNIQTLHADHLSPEEIEKILEEEEALLEQEEKDKFVDNWKPGMRRRPLQTAFDLESFQHELEPEKHEPLWKTNLDKRCGALAIKAGMMPVYDDWGMRHACTVLYMDQNIVTAHMTMERDGYMAIQVAAGQRKRKNVGRSVLGQYKGILKDEEEDPPYLMREFRISESDFYIPIGQQIHASHFCPGQSVDVAAISKGKGFQGPMKRHGFSGMGASHGVSLNHRGHGSTGACQDPGRVWKGKKMAGRMGGDRVTVQNLRVLQVDRGRNLVFVIGAVPGPRGRFVELRDAVKKPGWRTALVRETRPPTPTFPADETIDGCGQPGHIVFMPLPQRDPLGSDMDEEAA